MLSETQFNLLAGAAHVSAIIMLLAAAAHAFGVSELFINSGPLLLLELVAGFVVTFIAVAAIASVFQWLSMFTPIPPVVADSTTKTGDK